VSENIERPQDKIQQNNTTAPGYIGTPLLTHLPISPLTPHKTPFIDKTFYADRNRSQFGHCHNKSSYLKPSSTNLYAESQANDYIQGCQRRMYVKLRSKKDFGAVTRQDRRSSNFLCKLKGF
jgi:hypothetical protein